MKRILLLVIVLLGWGVAYGHNIVTYHDTEVEASEAYINGNDFQKDLLLYADMLGDTHPYFADSKHRAALDKRVRKLYKECGTLSDVAEFRILLTKLATSLNDGHTAIYNLAPSNTIFPVRLTIDGDAPIIVDLCAEGLNDILGKEVRSINGKSPKQILKQARELLSADNDVNFENLATEYLMLTNFWTMLGMSSQELHLTFADKSSTTVNAIDRYWQELKIVQLQQQQSNRVTAPRRVLFDYQIFDKEGVCYLQFNQFADRVTHPQMEQLARFDEFMSQMMADIEAKEINTLVVDLQYNSGGNSALGNVLLSWLKPFGEIEQYSADVRISELMLERYPYYKEFTYDGKPLELGRVYSAPTFDHNREVQSSGNISQDSTYHVLNLDPERIFKGDVIFIQGKDTYSSATLLLTTARDNGIGKIVGEPSGGRPSHYGDILFCILPNTTTTVTVSHKHFIRPNRAKVECEYLTPDVLIDTNNPDKDWVWEWVVAHTTKQNTETKRVEKEDDSYLWDTIYSPSMNQ